MAPNKPLIILFILVVTLSSMIMSFEARHLLEDKKPDLKAIITKFMAAINKKKKIKNTCNLRNFSTFNFNTTFSLVTNSSLFLYWVTELLLFFWTRV